MTCSCFCVLVLQILSEVLNWIAQAVEEFGLGVFNVKASWGLMLAWGWPGAEVFVSF